MDSSLDNVNDIPSMSVLIPDGEDWSTLRVLRCLGSVPAIKVNVLSNNRFILPRFSRYCHRFKYHKISNSGLLEIIIDTIRKWKIDVVLPATLNGMIFLSQHQETISEVAHLVPLAKPELFKMTNDKWAFYKFTHRQGLPGPTTVFIGKAGEALRIPDIDAIEYPALLKPTSGSGGYGIVEVKEPSDLKRSWQDKRIIKGREYILQSYIPSIDFSLSVCCQNGKIIAHTLNRTISPSQKPFGIGGLVEYVDNEQVLDMGRKLVSSIGWNGVGDIDIVVDKRDQTVKILEFNPRFWQSLLGGMIAGVNFPLIWCLSSLGTSLSCNQHEMARYQSLSSYIRELYSRLIGRTETENIRWDQTNLRFIRTDPLPEIFEALRRLSKIKKVRSLFRRNPKNNIGVISHPVLHR